MLTYVHILTIISISPQVNFAAAPRRGQGGWGIGRGAVAEGPGPRARGGGYLPEKRATHMGLRAPITTIPVRKGKRLEQAAMYTNEQNQRQATNSWLLLLRCPLVVAFSVVLSSCNHRAHQAQRL